MQGTSTSRRAPPIRYRDPMGAVDWLKAAFGYEPRFIARRSDGSFAYALMALGSQEITVTARDERSLAPAEVKTAGCTHVVTDVATHFARAKAAGAEVVRGLEAGAAAGRGYVCRDVEGNLWSFAGAQARPVATAIAWARAHMPRVDRLAAHRASIAAAAALTVVALSVPAWRLVAGAPAAKPLGIAEGQALEHARFALAEEQAARLRRRDLAPRGAGRSRTGACRAPRRGA